MLIDKFKVCLAVLLLLSVLYVVSYAVNTPIRGEEPAPDSNSVQTEVPQSNTADVNGIKETVSGQNGGMVDGNSQADQSAVQKEANLDAEEVVDQNATQGKPAKVSGSDQEWSRWITGKMIAIYIAVGLAVAIIVAWLLLRQTLRTRIRMKKIMAEDPDIDDFLIAFDWTSKVLYFPTMIASIVAANLMYLQEADVWFFSSINPKIIGSAWFTIFFLNFIIEEYNITIIMMITSLISIGFLFLWLNLVGWVSGFLKLFKHLALSISATGYLLVSIIGLLTILISWLKGLFYYVTITPNYMNLQEGPTETGEQIGREDYNTRIDTSDFFGRLLGFGKIIITFKDKKRQPIVLRVSNIRNKAQLLERVRAKLVIDHKLRNAVRPEPEPQKPA